MPFNWSTNKQGYRFTGFFQKGYLGGPDRPFIRVVVALNRFGGSKQVDMLLDTGSDITTLQPKDSLLMLDESQLMQLINRRQVQGLGGFIDSYLEDATVGFYLPDRKICWVPTVMDITDPYSGSTLPSTLGNDVLQYGSIGLNAARGIVTLALVLPKPIITSY